MADSSKRVAVYIDGSNFYFSIKKTFNCKVDIGKFCKKLAGNDVLVKIGYYIPPVNRRTHQERYIEQQKFLAALKKIEKMSITFGRLESYKKEGKTFYIEKATDINLALDVILDAIDDVYDKSYLVSNDGDFSGAVSAVIKRFKKEIIYVAVGTRKSISYHLKKVASSTLKIDKKFIDEVKL